MQKQVISPPVRRPDDYLVMLYITAALVVIFAIASVALGIMYDELAADRDTWKARASAHTNCPQVNSNNVLGDPEPWR